MTALKSIFLILMGFSSGLVIAGAVFAFIAIIGIVPRLAQKTGTQRYIKLYEEAIIWGGILGASTIMFDYRLSIGAIPVALLALCVGIFFGCLAVSLAEVLDVIPVLTRRARLQQGMAAFMLAIAIGKMAGSLLYYFVPGFFME